MLLTARGAEQTDDVWHSTRVGRGCRQLEMAAVPFLSPTTSDEASEASRVSRRNNSQRRDSARESLVEEALKRVAVCASLGRRLRLALLGEAESDKKECGDLLPSGSLTAQSSSAAPPANTTDCLSQCCAEAASAQAAAQGWSSFCCCAFPSIGAPQICRATVDRLHSMRAFTHQLAGADPRRLVSLSLSVVMRLWHRRFSSPLSFLLLRGSVVVVGAAFAGVSRGLRAC